MKGQINHAQFSFEHEFASRAVDLFKTKTLGFQDTCLIYYIQCQKGKLVKRFSAKWLFLKSLSLDWFFYNWIN